MTPLYREVHRWKALPFIWGETDCIMVLCDWIKQVRGVDPAEAARGTYDSRGSCHRETGFFRDPVGVLDRHFLPIGIDRTESLKPGDIGLIMAQEVDGRLSPCGALWLGEAWACRSPGNSPETQGYTISPKTVPDFMAAWGVGYEA
jgi:hypothetical protein